MAPVSPARAASPAAKRALSPATPRGSASTTSTTASPTCADSTSERASPTPKRVRVAAPTAAPAAATAAEVTGEAAQIYDRQIRLWGHAAQARMRSARVAVLGGSSRGLAAEAVKAMALAGVGKLVIVDPANVTPTASAANFFVAKEGGERAAEVVAAGARVLNPLVNVEARTDVDVTRVATEAEREQVRAVLASVDVAVLCDVPVPVAITINTMARQLGVKTLFAAVWGFNAVLMADLLEHTFLHESSESSADKDGDPIVTRHRITLAFPPLTEALAYSLATKLPPRQLKKSVTPTLLSFLAVIAYMREHDGRHPDLAKETDRDAVRAATAAQAKQHGVAVPEVDATALERLFRGSTLELAPVCAVAGNLLAQEVLKTVQGKQRPLSNLMIYTTAGGAGNVWNLGVVDTASVTVGE
ncbi:hypothetical protein AMAG_02924 [Allomyces macrogynus ATCC 38327]|uniref:THIF-type NAD/FAD binding fold domain-containing protein n=1 Tax=Allomyces macrogynus (strain ATCC 38327) TaxID=578462 RepID=A0A0L0S484_ALLM3|nr:hypothetical protein AMAG_02924 [Allomyces macrogynus ATCC 38327]|eukprot:KNE57179.1 hypothetical protein AMAG_02924 [Allomyces macrogynus ATCC 38327]